MQQGTTVPSAVPRKQVGSLSPNQVRREFCGNNERNTQSTSADLTLPGGFWRLRASHPAAEFGSTLEGAHIPPSGGFPSGCAPGAVHSCMFGAQRSAQVRRAHRGLDQLLHFERGRRARIAREEPSAVAAHESLVRLERAFPRTRASRPIARWCSFSTSRPPALFGILGDDRRDLPVAGAAFAVVEQAHVVMCSTSDVREAKRALKSSTGSSVALRLYGVRIRASAHAAGSRDDFEWTA